MPNDARPEIVGFNVIAGAHSVLPIRQGRREIWGSAALGKMFGHSPHLRERQIPYETVITERGSDAAAAAGEIGLTLRMPDPRPLVCYPRMRLA